MSSKVINISAPHLDSNDRGRVNVHYTIDGKDKAVFFYGEKAVGDILD